MAMTAQCTEGNHQDCPGTWHVANTGGDMVCACGHHFVPPSHGEVPVPEPVNPREPEEALV